MMTRINPYVREIKLKLPDKSEIIFDPNEELSEALINQGVSKKANSYIYKPKAEWCNET